MVVQAFIGDRCSCEESSSLGSFKASAPVPKHLIVLSPPGCFNFGLLHFVPQNNLLTNTFSLSQTSPQSVLRGHLWFFYRTFHRGSYLQQKWITPHIGSLFFLPSGAFSVLVLCSLPIKGMFFLHLTVKHSFWFPNALRH